MSETGTVLRSTPRSSNRRRGPRYFLRVLGVTAGADYKLKYSGSLLGYVWSVVKPLALFTLLYFVFGRIFKLDAVSDYYPQTLLLGIVCFYFFTDATNQAMYSLVSKESLLRKMVFPKVVIPLSAVLTATITFLVNLVVVGAFVAAAGITPRLSWALLPLLLLELLAFTTGVSLILATVFVRLRDISQVWDLTAQLFMYASPIMYPVGYLPGWAQQVVFLNPFTQIIQDARSLILYPDNPGNRITVDHALGQFGRLAPVGIAILFLAVGLALLKREEPWFAERV